mgnify:CR=1 FL=1|tara:strand:+ start:2307 stop:5702 length:3396 start_codon:yes stop_codon:yes gene_type:complete
MKKANRNLIPKLVRKSCATTLMMVLLPHPWISTASAQQQNSAIPMIMQGIQGVAGAVQQARVQAQMMTPIDLSPSMIKNVPAQNLPAPLNKCVIPQANIPMPRYCEQLGPVQEYTQPMGLGASPSYRSFMQTSEFAKKSILDLDRMLDEGKNEFSNGAITGVQCLKDSLTKEKTRQQGILNAIQGQIDKLNARNLQFKEQVKLVEMEMDKITRELTGQPEGKSGHVSDTINPPIKYFPPNCQKLVEKSSASVQRIGLVALKESSFKPTAISGGEFLANQQIYKNDIQRFINQTRSYIAQNGIDSFRESGGLPNFKGNEKLMQRVAQSIGPINQKIANEEKKIREELKKVGYDAPSLDKNFNSDFAAFKSDSKEYFRKQYVSNCVTNSNNGLTLDPKTILDALRQESTNNQGTTILSYKAALKNILEADSFMEDKIQQLKALDASYGEGNITLTLSNAQAKLERMPPYMYFQNAVQACVAEYNDDKTFSTSASGRSYATKVERAEAYLNDLKKLNDTYVAQMTEGIVDDIVNCSGRSTEAGSCKLGGENSFDVSSKGFCFASAQSCATEVNNCFAIADQLVQKKTAELTATADKFNGIVEGLFNDQARFFAEFKSSVLQEAGLLNALVPGADFKFPEDMFISLPELVLSNGVYVRGGSSEAIAAQLATAASKMKALKNELQQQGRLAENQLKNYIKEQESNIKESRRNFAEVVKACDQRLQEAEGITNNFNKTMQEEQDKKRAAASGFCRRFYNLSTNPAAACGDVEELYQDSLTAAQMVSPMAARYTNDLRNLCTATQSEREAGTEDERSSASTIRSDIASACSEKNDWNTAIGQYINQYADSLPDDSDSDKINAFLFPSSPQDAITEAQAREKRESLISSLSDDFKNDTQAMRDLNSVLNTVTQPTYDSSNFDLYSSLSLKTPGTVTAPAPGEDAAVNTANTSAATRVNALVAAINDRSTDAQTRLEKYKELNDLATSGATEVINLAKNALGGSADSSFASKYEQYKKHLSEARRLLPSGNTGDQCKALVAEVVLESFKDCLSESASDCVKKNYDEAIEEGDVTAARGLASLGLRPNGQANIEDEFARLGETGGMDCDALASNSRNPMNSLEAFDREILGDQYDDVMSGR